MSVTLLAALVTLRIQAKATPLDRSGEADFRKILTWAKDLDDVHVVIQTESRDTGHDPMYPGQRIDVWISGKKFRLEQSGYWGDGSYVVCDGATAMSDSQSEGDPAVIVAGKGSLLATCADLKIATDDLSPFFGLMKGPADLDKLVDKAAAIKQEANQGDEKVLSFQHKKLGTERFYYRLTKTTVQLDRIEYDNIPSMQDLFKSNPDWADAPDPGMLTRHSIYVAGDKPSSTLFDTKPPKGREFEDRRAKPKTGHGSPSQ